jgi:hypothetical protein
MRNCGDKVEHFQNDPDCKLFLISLKAGGLGLNLTAAEYVFLLDPWRNPAVESQAIEQAHRHGFLFQHLLLRDTVAVDHGRFARDRTRLVKGSKVFAVSVLPPRGILGYWQLPPCPAAEDSRNHGYPCSLPARAPVGRDPKRTGTIGEGCDLLSLLRHHCYDPRGRCSQGGRFGIGNDSPRHG